MCSKWPNLPLRRTMLSMVQCLLITNHDHMWSWYLVCTEYMARWCNQPPASANPCPLLHPPQSELSSSVDEDLGVSQTFRLGLLGGFKSAPLIWVYSCRMSYVSVPPSMSHSKRSNSWICHERKILGTWTRLLPHSHVKIGIKLEALEDLFRMPVNDKGML
jgi:hypothetical protein